MKKIMHFIHGMSMGGAETLVKDYLLNLNSKKYELVLLVLERCNTPYEELLVNSNIRVIYVDEDEEYVKGKGIISKLQNYISKYKIVKKIIQKEKPDILHYHLPIDSYVKYAKPNKNTKIFSTIHNEPQKLYGNSFKRKLELRAAKWLVKEYHMRFIVLHDDMRKEINKIFNVNNSIVVNNGIDFSRFSAPMDKLKTRCDLNIPKDAFVIGHIGRFSYQKNQTFLIDIFNEVCKKNKDAFLLMIGKGPDRESIEQKLKDLNRNNYLILEDRTDIPNLLNCMNVFVFPSNYEGLGIVLIEAQKVGIPCFKSDKVPNYACISNLITTLSLDDTAENWANSILNYKYPEKVILNDSDWDIKEVVKKLEDIYFDKC